MEYSMTQEERFLTATKATIRIVARGSKALRSKVSLEIVRAQSIMDHSDLSSKAPFHISKALLVPTSALVPTVPA
ncbi:uncharacterized protein PGTG_10197 [Puccinia graminis f. sp. tritici CRL 75-36-700-3]|uniref:Uncharacterized protein n=2 Tax=Puccinia graminis f. sp. tritici TaxID=56615 RepID=E3KJK2_PUCGT|nr:uncharacterized protein PGTG_10197 [Puccinia graminis f. sp. tritici CRL 75-36-700-3]EFP84477.2 hypothetical protein PGTG_10197 [Puccinia graminis f. sp. tritici CRL 75-36-700-3]